MPQNIIQKVQRILDIIPEDIRKIILNKYNGNIQSKNVSKLMSILEKLSDDEKKEFFIFSQDLLHHIGEQIIEEGMSEQSNNNGETKQKDLKNNNDIKGTTGEISVVKLDPVK